MNSTLVVLAQCTNFSAILVLLHPTSGYSEVYFYFEIHSEIAEIHVEKINLIKSNLTCPCNVANVRSKYSS